MNNICTTYPKVVFEVGVGQPSVSRTRSLWGTNVECHLFEPNPLLYEELKMVCNSYKNVFIHNVAISDEDGEGELYLAHNCSFVKGLDSPCSLQSATKESHKEWQKTKIKIASIENFDKGNVDLLLLDTEGAEFLCLKKMISRPQVIIIETHIQENIPPYMNPYFNEIMRWMWENNYGLIGKDKTDSYFKLIDDI